MNKKNLRIITTICMIVLMVCICSSVFAVTDPASVSIGTSNTFDNAGSTILGWIRAIGTFFAVGVLMILGIKYMMGSASEKAEYKKTMIPYFIGAILLFAAVNIAGFIYSASNSLSESASDGKDTGMVQDDTLIRM